jgi:transcriptional regulator with XRE-family HTH domain
MKDFEAQKIKTVLKALLRKKRLTYQDLASALKCSVPTVTRILGPEELSLSRLLQLCEILDVDLADLQNLVSQERETPPKFTPEQEVFLAKNQGHLAYFTRLLKNETPKQIAEKFKLTQRATDKYLVALERLGLIKVSAKQKIKPVFKDMPAFGVGPLGRAFYEAFIRNAAEFFVGRVSELLFVRPSENARKSPSKFSVQVARMTPATYEAWVKEMETLSLTYGRLAAFEENTRDEKDLMSAVVINAHTLVDKDYVGLQILEDTFGAVLPS